MSGDGDARGLEAAASAAAEAARELREAAAALVATRAAEEDALRRRAVALDADVRRLQGSLHALDSSTIDKVRLASHRIAFSSSTSPPARLLPHESAVAPPVSQIAISLPTRISDESGGLHRNLRCDPILCSPSHAWPGDARLQDY